MAMTLPNPMRPEPARRFHDLDALRAFAMLLGVVLHAIFWERIVNPSLENDSRFDVDRLVMDVIHGFRMPLFIVLSGFFTAMMWRRRGLTRLIRNRLIRVFLPLVVFTPIVATLSIEGWSLNPHVRVSEVIQSDDPARLEAFFKTEDINTRAIAGLTPLQLAAISGKVESVRWLIAAGADLAIATARKGASPGDTALDLARKSGRGEIESLLVEAGAPAQCAKNGENPRPLMFIDFGHLWFLWFLAILICGFVAMALVLERYPVPRPPAWLFLGPARYLWLLPLTLVLQSFMTSDWGPDTVSGVFVPPYLLAYYALFFGFGAVSHDVVAQAGEDTRAWRFELPIALLVVFPLGMALLSTNRVPRLITDALAAAFAWMMIFGLMGLCRRWLARENPRVRYVSDASYFVYIMHMPVLLILSNTLARFALPRPVKILLLCIVTVGLLLWVYEHGVRYHWLGRWLNGPRERPGRLGPSSAGLSGMPSRWPGHPTRLDGTKNPRFRGLVPRMKRMLSFSYP